jgi:hypothetical protein
MINVHKIKLIFLTLLVLSSTTVLGEDNDYYYRNVFLGEKKTSNYFGPLDPRSQYGDDSGQLTLMDDLYKDHYLNPEIQEETFDLHRYWFSEVVEKSACPNSVLSENLDYIRYLYRLVSISYLFEGLKINNKISRQLGNKNSCSIAFKDIFQGCTPESSDMKKFQERVYGKFVNEIEKIHVEAFSKKETAEWLNIFQDSTSLTTNPAFSRLHDWCIANKKNCRSLKVDEIKEALDGFCKNDVTAMKLLCSEKDSFYGLSNVSTATELIKSSNAFSIINQTGMGEECLRRYGKLFHSKENNVSSISKQFPLIYSSLRDTKGRYIQGELFLPGSLKEFDSKGLSDFLSALKPPKPQPVVIIKPKPKPIPKPVVVAIAPIKVEEKKVEPIIIQAPEPVKPAISEFERAVIEVEKKSGTVALDMDLFRDDFEFTQTMITDLSGPIKKFQTRSALSDMKSYDLLGSKDAPVGLVFLKFLIDTENHQGLYNIVTVIGEKFYVMNDLEKKSEPHLIELKNDASTKNRWQIFLLKK